MNYFFITLLSIPHNLSEYVLNLSHLLFPVDFSPYRVKSYTRAFETGVDVFSKKKSIFQNIIRFFCWIAYQSRNIITIKRMWYTRIH